MFVVISADGRKSITWCTLVLFHRLLHTHHHPLSRAGTVGQRVADIPSGLSLIPPHKLLNEEAIQFLHFDVHTFSASEITSMQEHTLMLGLPP
jgi:hypothetical protein